MPTRTESDYTMTDQSELKNMGLKATFPRLKILDIFRKSDQRHLSAEDVYRALIGENVEIGLATVYRVLTQFEQAGILARSQFDSGKAVFELNDGDHHDHLICTNCGKVVEFSDPTSRSVSRRSPRTTASRWKATPWCCTASAAAA